VTTRAESAALGFVRSINERGEKNLPRLQMRVLAYFIDQEFLPPRFFAQAEIPALARHLGRRQKSVEDAVRALVRGGALIETADDLGHPQYAFDAGWR
jgi:hypothetical protein